MSALTKGIGYSVGAMLIGASLQGWAGSSTEIKQNAKRQEVVVTTLAKSEDASRLHKAIETEGEYISGNKSISIQCFYVVAPKPTKIPDSQCEISLIPEVNLSGMDDILVSRVDGYFKTYIYNQVDAKNLFELLAVKENQGKSEIVKLFKTSDYSLTIQCNKSLLPINPNPYACYIEQMDPEYVPETTYNKHYTAD